MLYELGETAKVVLLVFLFIQVRGVLNCKLRPKWDLRVYTLRTSLITWRTCNFMCDGFHQGTITLMDVAAQRPIIVRTSNVDKTWGIKWKKRLPFIQVFLRKEIYSVLISERQLFIIRSHTRWTLKAFDTPYTGLLHLCRKY